MSKNTNTATANAYCHECRFYRGLHNTYLDRYGRECETHTHERCTRKATASDKAFARFNGIKAYCFKAA